MPNFILAAGLLRAELLKLKRSPVIYILVLGVLLTASGAFLAHLLDAYSVVKLNVDPWERYFYAALAIFTLFIVVPYLVLMVSAVVFVEQRAAAWKYLYTLPPGRGAFYFAKLGIMLLLFALSMLALLAGLVASGYLLHWFRPEYELNYYRPSYEYLLTEMTHYYVASLGLIAWQYWLALRFRNILVSLGIGVFGFVFGLIMSVTGQKAALYIPYALPMLVRDMEMFRNEHVAPSMIGGLNNVELHSILYGVFFALLGYWWERRREVV